MIDFFRLEVAVRRALGPVGRWAPPRGRRYWWFRYWMYPPNDTRRLTFSGGSWELNTKFWLRQQLAKVIPGWCTECPGTNYTHKMRCPKLHGVPGKRLWSQDG